MKKVFLLNKYQHRHAVILQSRACFESWYLNFHGEDLSIFLREDILALLDEVEPDHYPCYALFQSESFDVTYVAPDLITFLVGMQ